MAVDTRNKRASAIACRRLPWMRRFLPLADGTIDQGDRQHVAFVYRGILAGEPVAVPDPPFMNKSFRILRTINEIFDTR